MTTNAKTSKRPDQSESLDVTSTRTGKRPFRLAWRIGIGLIVLAALLVLLGPTLVSTSAGTRLALSYINKTIVGTVHADALSLGWFSGQQITAVRLDDKHGQRVLSADRIDAPDLTLFSLLRGGRAFGTLHVVNPTARVERFEDGTDNLNRALSSPDATGQAQPASHSAASSNAGQSHQPFTLPNGLQLSLKIDGGHMTYVMPQTPTVQLTDFVATVNVFDPQRIEVAFKTKTRQGDHEGGVESKFHVNQLFDAYGRFAPNGVDIDAQAQINTLPVAAIDQLLGQNGKLAALLGQFLDGKLSVKGNLTQLEATVWAQTQNLHASIRLVGDQNQITVKPDSMFTLVIEPEAWDRYNQAATTAQVAKLAQPFQIQLSVNELSIGHVLGKIDANNVKGVADLIISDIVLDAPNARVGRVAIRGVKSTLTFDGPDHTAKMTLSANAEQAGQTGSVNLTCSAINPVDEQGRLNRAGINAELHGRIDRLPLAAIDRILNTESLLTAAIGPVLYAQIDAKLKSLTREQTLAGNFSITAKAQNLNAVGRGKIVDSNLVIDPSSQIHLAVEPSLVATLKGLYPSLPATLQQIKIVETANVQVEFTDFVIPFTPTEQPITELGLRVSVDQIVLAGDPRLEDISLHNVVFVLPNALKDKPIDLFVEGDLLHRDQTSTVRADLHLDDPAENPHQFRGSVRFNLLPTSLLESVAQRHDWAKLWLGDRLDKVSFELAGDANRPFSFGCRVTSDQLLVDLAGQYDPQAKLVALRKDAWVMYEVTPELFANQLAAYSQGEPNDPASTPQIVMDQPLQLKLVVGQAQVGLPQESAASEPPLPIDPNRVKLHLKLTGDGTTVKWRDRDQALRLKNIVATLTTTSLAKDIGLAFQAQITPQYAHSDKIAPSNITSRTKVTGLFNPAGEFDLGRANIVTHTKADRIPIDLIDAIAGWEGQLVGLIGPTASLSLQSQTNTDRPSDIDLTIESDNAQAHLAVSLDETPTLRTDASTSFNLTPELSQQWLKRINPILNEAVSSGQPIRFTLKRDGFILPKGDLTNWRQIQMDAELDIGSLRFKKDGLMNSIRRQFKQDTTQAPEAHFTPMKIRLQDGILSYSDMTMRMDSLTLGFHGRIDQANNRVDLIMAISGQTLGKAFGLGDDIIEPGYEFQVPIRGTMDNPKMDLGAVAAEIARLMARSQIKKHIGGVEGELLDLLLGGKKKNR